MKRYPQIFGKFLVVKEKYWTESRYKWGLWLGETPMNESPFDGDIQEETDGAEATGLHS